MSSLKECIPEKIKVQRYTERIEDITELCLSASKHLVSSPQANTP